MIYIFAKIIQLESINHALRLQIVKCCLKNIEWLLSGTKMPLRIQKDDAIKRNRIFFDFMLRMFNHLNQFYEKEKSLLVDTILKYQLRNESAKEVKKPNRYNKTRHGNKEDTSNPSPEKSYFVDETNKTS